MGKISDDMKTKESREEIRKMKEKLTMIEASRNQRSEELKQANVKV